MFNTADLCRRAALDGLGIALLPDELAEAHVSEGRLVPLLHVFCPVFTGLHLYYPSRRQMPAALALVVDALRFRAS